MKRSANIETIVSVLTYGMSHRKNKTCVIGDTGLPVSLGKPLLDELTKQGLMKQREDRAFVTTSKGADYLSKLRMLNNSYGIDMAIKILEEAKNKYYSTRKPSTP